MRRCHSCNVEIGSMHLPSCESRDRDEKGRFVLPEPPDVSARRDNYGRPLSDY